MRGIVNVDPVNELDYQAVIAEEVGFSNPPTLAQVQAIIDRVNANYAALIGVLEDSASVGGNANADGTPVSVAQLSAIAGIMDVDPLFESDYQSAIVAEEGFSNPPTLAEVQAIIDRVNTCLLYTSPSPRDKRQSRMPSSA